MKGLLLRIVFTVALLLWAIDMVFPWHHYTAKQNNHYQQIQQRGSLIVGTINHPVSYFINSNGEAGLEYELTKAFAQYLGVKLKIKTFRNTKTLFQALNDHQIDLAAANLIFSPERAEDFQIGPTYYSSSWQVIYRKGEKRPYTVKELINATKTGNKLIIPQDSDVETLLLELKNTYPELIWQTNNHFSPEQALLEVADGKADYTIVDSLDVRSAQQVKPNLAVAFDLNDETSVNWYLANDRYNELQAALLNFMHNATENGTINRLEEKYFSHFNRFNSVDMRAYLNAIQTILPQYIPLFQKYAGSLDWRLLAAIAYQESHWDSKATSPTGVRGMMMLTRETANHMKISDRTDPEQSIKAGSAYLQLLMNKLPASIPKEDRIWFALVAYNMGLGHLLDLRRLTQQLGGNPNNWLDVKQNLPLLSNKKYYSKLKYGYANGYQAYQYVENIRRYMNSIINYYRIQKEQTNNQN
ncbi:lytic transglycosylase F [Mergibacter septicus]|uniref:membrane-bound lytic murein transglycosylase MltF n=1 Tax=Mergibacter septicus TaxID=221402 RepID=UPI0011791F29|nr:membrane-bound lytic murein transglycosylase MltF [Mergibacter septicus]AWX13742.1 lytic transglycosylase F [Mergibacter septicus]